MTEELCALANGQRMGSLIRDGKRLRFRYDDDWRASNDAFPLSLSMPLAVAEHDTRVVDPFLWGLLPDNTGTLEEWGRRFHVSSRNAFRLLAHVGEDCAGAVQFVRPEREKEVLAADAPAVTWLSELDLEERVTLLLANHGTTRLAADTGQFSLAGAQPKLALHRDPSSGRWGVPAGRVPTTHILKPATGDYDGYAENEHFCLRLARALGLPVPKSEVLKIGPHHVIAVTRYDRRWVGDICHRIHQEDLCQALAVHPRQKYQNEGGPSVKELAAAIRDYSSEPTPDVFTFASALLFNWLISGTDAHTKNYSLLIAPGGQVRLAPLYDLASALPYPRQIDPRKARLAMKIGSTYRIHEITDRHWDACAADLRLPPDRLRERLAALKEKMPGLAREVASKLKDEGIDHPVISDLEKAIAQRPWDK